MRQGRTPSSEFASRERRIFVKRIIIMKRIVRFGLALPVIAAALMTNARAEDPIAAWNQISENAVKLGKHPLPVTSVEFAIVPLAIYDAVESIDGRYEPYHTRVPGATGSLSGASAH